MWNSSAVSMEFWLGDSVMVMCNLGAFPMNQFLWSSGALNQVLYFLIIFSVVILVWVCG
jgi:hypothetical protein